MGGLFKLNGTVNDPPTNPLIFRAFRPFFGGTRPRSRPPVSRPYAAHIRRGMAPWGQSKDWLAPLQETDMWHDHIKHVGQYRSKFETSLAQQLSEAGVKFRHESVRLTYNQCSEFKTYIPDFTVRTKDGTRVFIEAKGWLNTQAASKMACVRASNPTLDIRFVFQSGTTRVGKLKSTNIQWAKRLKYPAAVGTIPEAWMATFMTEADWLAFSAARDTTTRKAPDA